MSLHLVAQGSAVGKTAPIGRGLRRNLLVVHRYNYHVGKTAPTGRGLRQVDCLGYFHDVYRSGKDCPDRKGIETKQSRGMEEKNEKLGKTAPIGRGLRRPTISPTIPNSHRRKDCPDRKGIETLHAECAGTVNNK